MEWIKEGSPMCGINGIVMFKSTTHAELYEKVRVMVEMTQHRGPEKSDILIMEQAAIGMSRLAIMAPTEDSTIQAADGKYGVFNGELVNHRQLRLLLKEPPVDQHTDSAV